MSFINHLKFKVKHLVLPIDTLLLKLIGPYLLKNVSEVNLSFDDVEYTISKGDLLLNRNFGEFVTGLQIPLDLFLFNSMSSGDFELKSFPMVAWNVHVPAMYNESYFVQHTPTTCIARFHYFKATSGEIQKFKGLGGRVLLTANDNIRCSYDLSKDETLIVNRTGGFVKNDIEYLKTNLRFEKLFIPQLLKNRIFKRLVIFGHEWGMNEWHNRLLILIKILKNNKVNFIN